MQKEAIVDYSDGIRVVSNRPDVTIEITQQGPQGPQGEKGAIGDVTPEVQRLHDETIAARNETLAAQNEAEIASQSANEDALKTSEDRTYIETVRLGMEDLVQEANKTSEVIDAAIAANNEIAAAVSRDAMKAEQAKSDAEIALNGAVAAETASKNAQSAAETAQHEAITAKTTALDAKSSAEKSATTAKEAADFAGKANTATQSLLDEAKEVAADIEAASTLNQNINTEVQAAKKSAEEASYAANDAKSTVLAARDEAAGARNSAQIAATQADKAKTDAESANTNAGAARIAAEAAAERAEIAAEKAELLDPDSYVLKKNNAADFDNPELVRDNIGAQEKLEPITQEEAAAGTATESRLWSAERVAQAIKSLSAAVNHTHTVGQVDGLQQIIDALAPLTSPEFTGTPTAPAPLDDDNSQRIATTNWVLKRIEAVIGSAPEALDTLQELSKAMGDDPNFAATVTSELSKKSNIGHKHNVADVEGLRAELDAKATIASPALSGTPTAPTAVAKTNTDQIATTKYVERAVKDAGYSPSSHIHEISDITGLQDELDGKAAKQHKHSMDDVTGLDAALNLKAPLDSPALSGQPTAPTPDVDDNTTNIATTSFVATAISNAAGKKADKAHTHDINDVTDLQASLDKKANSASPAFTGEPTAPTAKSGDNTTKLATTAFVASATSAMGALKADLEHTHEIAQINSLQEALDAKAALDSPEFTGKPTTPTATAGDKSTTIASTAFVDAAIKTAISASEDNFYNKGTADKRYGLLDAALVTWKGKASFGGDVNVTGAVLASGNVTAFSDRRLKKNIVIIPHALNKIQHLHGYTFDRIDINARQTGVIAQEVKEVLPEAVIETPKGLAVAYGNMIGLLIEAIKELNQEIIQLKSKSGSE